MTDQTNRACPARSERSVCGRRDGRSRSGGSGRSAAEVAGRGVRRGP